MLAALLIPQFAHAQTTTREAFVLSVNQICGEIESTRDARARRATGRVVVDPAKPRSSAKIIEISISVAREGFERIAALPQPPGDEAAIQAWVDGTFKGIRMLKKVARVLRAKDFGDFRDVRRYSRLINRAADQLLRALRNVQPLGITGCA